MIQLIIFLLGGLISFIGVYHFFKKHTDKTYRPDDPYEFKWEPIILLGASFIILYLLMR